tara:strand:- start:6083 stop:6214 length:132 start_codon:yes stop_codon:yes gene_type:complete
MNRITVLLMPQTLKEHLESLVSETSRRSGQPEIKIRKINREII